MDDLSVPAVQELVQTDGVILLADQSKWTEVASKVAIVVASASSSEALQLQISEKIAAIQKKQHELATQLKAAVIQVAVQAFPDVLSMLAQTLSCSAAPVDKVDWGSATSTLQQLADMNLQLRLPIDALGLLGAQKSGQSGPAPMSWFLETTTKFFGQCAAVADWMTHGNIHSLSF